MRDESVEDVLCALIMEPSTLVNTTLAELLGYQVLQVCDVMKKHLDGHGAFTLRRKLDSGNERSDAAWVVENFLKETRKFAVTSYCQVCLCQLHSFLQTSSAIKTEAVV